MKRGRDVSRLVGGLALSAIILVQAGCTLVRAKQDIARIDRLVELRGATTGGATEHPVIVVLIREDQGRMTVWNHHLRYGPGPFRFLVSPGGTFLFAFEDRNGDLNYQKSEPAAWYGGTKPVKIVLKAGATYEGLTIALSGDMPEGTDAVVRREQTVDASVRVGGQLTLARGEVVSLEDARFTLDRGREGLWQPAHFAVAQGFGIYFLEPFDRAKIPVLFVHGVGGSPQEFRTIIDHLDRTRFQPWFYQYPSALRLDALGDDLVNALSDIYARHPFGRLFVVAHSMGGLVSRAAINEIVAQYPHHPLRLFITISTPWDGIEFARLGVDYSPVVIPSWIDVVPDSPFLTKLFARPLPQSISSYLFFGVVGGNGTDGVVPLTSELSLRAQADASRIYGFPESHTSILHSPTVIERLNALLDQAAQ